MQDLRVSLIQASLSWENPAENRQRFGELIDAHATDSDLIVLPETFTTGFTMAAASHAEEVDGNTTQWLQDQAAKHSVAICGSLIIQDNGKFFNRLVFACPGGSYDTYDKRHLFRMVGESGNFTPGKKRKIFKLGDWRIRPLICYDLRFPVWSRGSNEFDLMIYVANWPASRKSAWETLLPARAVENLCYTVGVNRVGTDGNGVEYAGGSLIADYYGNLIESADDKTKTIRATLSLKKLNAYREKFPAWKDADDFSLTES